MAFLKLISFSDEANSGQITDPIFGERQASAERIRMRAFAYTRQTLLDDIQARENI